MGDLRVGLGLPVSGGWATLDTLRHVATRADDLGYASLWTFQRLLHPVDEEWGPASPTAGSAAAGRT